MIEILNMFYPWIKSLHIIAVISWMAGIFYLPRLFVHHVESATHGTDTDILLQKMELKLYKLIMGPAMMVTWVCGLLLIAIPGTFDWSSIWPWIKLLSVFGMTVFHVWLGNRRKDIAAGTNQYSGRTYRLMNEVPTVLMIVIVIMVIVRPF